MNVYAKTALLLTLGLCVAAVVVSAAEGEAKAKKKVTKLQIGVKKRVENCKVKSRRGDSLQMHYTVRFKINIFSLSDRFDFPVIFNHL